MLEILKKLLKIAWICQKGIKIAKKYKMAKTSTILNIATSCKTTSMFWKHTWYL